MYLNKAIIVGNLTRDPELKALPSGDKVCSFSVATNRVWKDKDGAKQETADFHNIISFGKQAENIAQYMVKSSQILVEGRIQTRSWEKDGVKRYATEIVAENVQFGSKKEQSSQPEPEEVAEDKTAIDPDSGVDLNNREDIPF